MALSFEEIMNRPASEIKSPEAYPVGTYHCLVDGIPEHGKSSKAQTDFLQFKFKILSPMEDVDQQKAAEMQMVGKTITENFYVKEGIEWRLLEFLRDSLGIEEEGKSPTEMVSEAPGKQVLVTLRHEPSQDGKRVFHRVARTAHV